MFYGLLAPLVVLCLLVFLANMSSGLIHLRWLIESDPALQEFLIPLQQWSAKLKEGLACLSTNGNAMLAMPSTGTGIRLAKASIERSCMKTSFAIPIFDAAYIARISVIVQSLTWLLEALLGLRVVLKLISHNPDNAFVNFIYNLSGVFAQPFQGIVGEPTSNGATLELNVLLAMLIYLLLAYGLLQLIRVFFIATEPIDQ